MRKDLAKSDLQHLAQKINAAHRRAEAAGWQALEHARTTGQLLLEAKAKLPGEWERWVETHAEFSIRTAQYYIKVCEHWPELKTQRVASFRQAIAYLTEPRPSPEVSVAITDVPEEETHALVEADPPAAAAAQPMPPFRLEETKPEPKEPTPTQREKITAYHEAGHAVMAHLLRVPIQEVKVADGFGRVIHADTDALTRCRILAAGWAAEEQFCGLAELRDTQDRHQLRESVRQWFSGVTLQRGSRKARPLPLSETTYDWAEKMFLSLARDHFRQPPIWVAVQSLADLLQKKKRLSGPKVMQLLDRQLKGGGQ
jgi:hypothetical protein